MPFIKPPSNESLPAELQDRQIMAFALTNFGGNGYVPHGRLLLAHDEEGYSLHRCFTQDMGESWGTENGLYGVRSYLSAWSLFKEWIE